MAARKKKNRDPLLAIEGNMCIAEAADMRETLLTSMGEKAGLSLDLGKVTECDLAGVQLLWAARLSASGSKKTFEIPRASQAVREAFRRAGLNPEEMLSPGKEKADG